MSPGMLFSFVIGYFILLLVVAWYTSKGSNNESFFIGNRKSNWMLVAFGMIGTSLSGVTFVSVPGGVGSGNFFYFQIVLGYLLGYLVIAFVLLPLYYRMNLTSIYTYLEKRFGINAHKAGASFFILSRSVGATARLYLVINILQLFILDKLGIPFIVTTLVILAMILLYTFEGGVKTIIYTDTLQTSGKYQCKEPEGFPEKYDVIYSGFNGRKFFIPLFRWHTLFICRHKRHHSRTR
jgi:Na+/proline symporter